MHNRKSISIIIRGLYHITVVVPILFLFSIRPLRTPQQPIHTSYNRPQRSECMSFRLSEAPCLGVDLN